MTLLQRIGYYLGGFSIGLVILAFFLTGKKASCSYFPEARVIKNINTKKIIYSDGFKRSLLEHNIDTTRIRSVLKLGNIDFSKSDSRKKPCGIYFLEGDRLSFLVENCDSIATLSKLKILAND